MNTKILILFMLVSMAMANATAKASSDDEPALSFYSQKDEKGFYKNMSYFFNHYPGDTARSLAALDNAVREISRKNSINEIAPIKYLLVLSALERGVYRLPYYDYGSMRFRDFLESEYPGNIIRAGLKLGFQETPDFPCGMMSISTALLKSKALTEHYGRKEEGIYYGLLAYQGLRTRISKSKKYESAMFDVLKEIFEMEDLDLTYERLISETEAFVDALSADDLYETILWAVTNESKMYAPLKISLIDYGAMVNSEYTDFINEIIDLAYEKAIAKGLDANRAVNVKMYYLYPEKFKMGVDDPVEFAKKVASPKIFPVFLAVRQDKEAMMVADAIIDPDYKNNALRDLRIVRAFDKYGYKDAARKYMTLPSKTYKYAILENAIDMHDSYRDDFQEEVRKLINICQKYVVEDATAPKPKAR